ncbi:DUF3907 family protein [Falsibacillus pallidus]|uniref:Uncharacterized protein DUF3907 n=1 Tax=Falsibacillus pallidus TaxID=493781 RepID=A0A370GFW6_9BACI|nr:DUF3907 family protein [Falsibacillus pallidus]RDI41284.1 uncharacterized protein DUF3907 [Falsibacillus pallidus]
MRNSIVQTQTEEVKRFLEKTIGVITGFLNETKLSELIHEEGIERDYSEGLLSVLRRILVSCEDGKDACSLALKCEPFNKMAAEKALYSIYHLCIEEFFSPKNDSWYEDPRSAYTGRQAIKFRKSAPQKVQELISTLELDFQRFREELDYYETDYRTKMMQSK